VVARSQVRRRRGDHPLQRRAPLLRGAPSSGSTTTRTRRRWRSIPYEFHERDFEIETSGVRQLGHAVKHRVTVGHDLTVRRPEVLDSFPADDVAQAAFERGRAAALRARLAAVRRYALLHPWYRVYRNIDSFDLAEDVQLGPEARFELGAAREEIGSEANFVDLVGVGRLDPGHRRRRPRAGLGRARPAAARTGSTSTRC
jgi:hypothetical protein